jgi:hypothetical protein
MARGVRVRNDEAGFSVFDRAFEGKSTKKKVSRLGWKVGQVEDVSIDERSVDFDESRWKMIRKSGANQLRRLD